MNSTKRKALAFLVSVLYRGRSIELLDIEHLELIKFIVTKSGNFLDIHDEKWQVCLGGEIEENEILLYDFEDDDITSLSLDGPTFKGYDFHSEFFYKGHIREDLLIVHDSESEQEFEYRIMHSKVPNTLEN